MAKKAAEEKAAKVLDDRAKALETTLASLEKQVGKLGEDTRKAQAKQAEPAPAPEPRPAPKKDPSGIQRLIDRIFGLR